MTSNHTDGDTHQWYLLPRGMSSSDNAFHGHCSDATAGRRHDGGSASDVRAIVACDGIHLSATGHKLVAAMVVRLFADAITQLGGESIKSRGRAQEDTSDELSKSGTEGEMDDDPGDDADDDRDDGSDDGNADTSRRRDEGLYKRRGDEGSARGLAREQRANHRQTQRREGSVRSYATIPDSPIFASPAELMSFTPIILLEGSKLVAAVVCADCAPPGKATAFNYTAYAEEAFRRGPSPRWADHERVAEQLSPLPPAVCRDQPGFDARGRPLQSKGSQGQGGAHGW